MSLYDYHYSHRLIQADPPFYAMVMALMRKADGYNLALLKASWPEVYVELERRYNAPGGIIEGDPEYTTDEHQEILRLRGDA